MKKFKTSGVGYPIEEVEADHETDNCVWVRRFGGREFRRTNKRSNYENYFDTWKQAHDFLYQEALKIFNNAKATVANAEKQLDAIIAMREPKTGEAS